MQKNIYSAVVVLVLAFLLISPSHTKQEGALLGIKSKKSVAEMENSDDFLFVMGVEECENGDEDCLKRRVLADAHLDYIYTQHHKH